MRTLISLKMYSATILPAIFSIRSHWQARPDHVWQGSIHKKRPRFAENSLIMWCISPDGVLNVLFRNSLSVAEWCLYTVHEYMESTATLYRINRRQSVVFAKCYATSIRLMFTKCSWFFIKIKWNLLIYSKYRFKMTKTFYRFSVPFN